MSTPLSRAMDQMAETDRLLEENISLRAEITRLKAALDHATRYGEGQRETVLKLDAEIERLKAISDSDAWANKALRAEIERLKADRELLRECIKTRNELGERMIDAEARLAKVVEALKRMGHMQADGWCWCCNRDGSPTRTGKHQAFCRQARAALAAAKGKK